ncbi:MAG TPA: MoaD/ThiS family protein [bacterium]
MASVYIPSPLRRLTGGRGQTASAARSIREMLDDLERQFPGMKAELCDERGDVRSFINTFVNGTEIRQLRGLDTPLADADEVSIIPAMAGGLFTMEMSAWPEE